MELEGRTAIITGASRGIGRSIAELFAAEGASVALVSRSADSLEEVAGGIRAAGGAAHVIAADVTVPDAAERIVAETTAAFSSVDVLVNNAGGNSFMAPISDLRPSGWHKAIALNLDSAVQLIQAALPALTASGHGSIVNVSSVTALRAAPLLGAYGAAKAALVSATQTLAVELGTQPVRVNALVPGWIATDLTEFLRHGDGLEESVLSRVPMGRWGRPEEIAQAALFLAGDRSSFMTGQSLVVDGGLSTNP
jgi:NAD(P)-dependent dehydrogenase (short-subunit alcohol dehydrogenase family)